MQIKPAQQFNAEDDGFLVHFTKKEFLYVMAALGWIHKEDYENPISNFWSKGYVALVHSIGGKTISATKFLTNPYKPEMYKYGNEYYPNFSKDWEPKWEMLGAGSDNGNS